MTNPMESSIHTPETKLQTKLRQSKTTDSWEQWKGMPDRALAHLTDDIYAYEIKNHPYYGDGVALKYSDMNFFYSPVHKTLFTAGREKITTDELRESGDTVMAEQLNRLIGLALEKQK